MKITRKIKQQVEESKEEMKMKNWSLKKKILVGMGVLGTAVVGAIAYGMSRSEDEVDYQDDESEDDESDVYDDEELRELEEMEKEEASEAQE